MTDTICENIFPGTKIITDQWGAYSKALSTMNEMAHETVNRSLNFVDSSDKNVHTQNIEGLWSRSKYFLSKRKRASI